MQKDWGISRHVLDQVVVNLRVGPGWAVDSTIVSHFDDLLQFDSRPPWQRTRIRGVMVCVCVWIRGEQKEIGRERGREGGGMQHGIPWTAKHGDVGRTKRRGMPGKESMSVRMTEGGTGQLNFE